MKKDGGWQKLKGEITDEIYKFTWKDVLITLGILLTATIVALVYYRISASNINVIMFYTLALLFISRLTSGYLPGIAAAMISVVCVNFLFTYPYGQINFILEGYPVTFICMLVVSVLTSASASHMKRQSRILADREKKLAEAEKEKMRANLLRAVSHDLRTPLTGIIGASSSYLENEARLDTDEKRTMVRHIREDANWLLNMVENLLTVTRIQNDESHVSTSLEVVEEVVSEAVQRLRKRIPHAKINVSIPEAFLMVPMDPLLIEQVIMNLLENAVIHSESKQPVDLVVTDSSDSVTFHVIDYGKGLDEDKIPSLFEGQSASGSSDSHKGMGIGLSICKTIIQAHNGTICAFNHENGAEFSFTLPKEGIHES